MAETEYSKIIKQGVKVWNEWRIANPDIKPDLRNKVFVYERLPEIDLSSTDLAGAMFLDSDFPNANFSGARLINSQIDGVNFIEADFGNADLSDAQIDSSNFERSSFRNATLFRTCFNSTGLKESDFSNALLGSTKHLKKEAGAPIYSGAIFRNPYLEKANFSSATLGYTIFADVDLSTVQNLETCKHAGPSNIDFNTLLRSRTLPQTFLRGCGLPDALINYYSSISKDAIQFYSCFISYSSKDEHFAKKLYADLQNNGIRCWFAPEDLKIGAKIRPTIDDTIRLYDKLLLVLSEHSVMSQWVEQEVETALDRERRQNELVLFPIRLDDAVMDMIGGWPALITHTRNIGNFCQWKDRDTYQTAFARLLRDLKASEAQK